MFGLSLAPYRLELSIFFKIESIWSKKHVPGVSMFFDPVNAIYWPCWNYIWYSITSGLAGALKLSRLSQCGWKHTSMMWLMYGPLQFHVWTLLRPYLALLYIQTGQSSKIFNTGSGLRHMSMQWPLFGIRMVQYLDHTWTIFCLTILFRLTTMSWICARVPNLGQFQKCPDFRPEFSEIPIFVPKFQKMPIFSEFFTYLRLNVPIFVPIFSKNYTYLRPNIPIFQKSWISSQIFCIFKIVPIFPKALWSAWLLNQLKIQNVQDKINMLEGKCVWGVYFFGQF